MIFNLNNRKIRRITCLILLTVAAISLFSACKNEKNSVKPVELRYGFTTEPTTLDPLNSANTADGRSILFNVFEGLIKPKIDGTFSPCIAESWTVEQQGLVYNFTLRNGVRFHDGSLLTGADVKFSLDTAIAAGFNGLGNVAGVSMKGDNQITVTLNSPDPDFLPFLTVGIVKAGNTNREKDITGTGPFRLESYTPQRNLILTKFDSYWQNESASAVQLQRGFHRLDKVTIVFYANYDTLMVALRGGGIDGAFITGAMAAQLDKNQFDIIHNNSAAVQLLALNNGAFPLDDIRVRLALNYGIDIQGIIDAAFFGQGFPSGSPVIPGLSAYYQDNLSYAYKPDLARSLLAEAGFNSANRLSLEITVPSNFTMHVDTAQVIVNQLEKIGVNASISLVDWSTWLSDVYYARKYQATIISLDSPIVSPRSFLERYQSGNRGNFINFNSADFDRVFNAVLSELDSEKRAVLYRDAQRIVAENAASVYIQDILYFIVLRAGAFGGALNYPLYVIDFAGIYGISSN